MNKELVTKAIISAIKLISDELNSIENEDLKSDFEITLEELERALKEIQKL